MKRLIFLLTLFVTSIVFASCGRTEHERRISRLMEVHFELSQPDKFSVNLIELEIDSLSRQVHREYLDPNSIDDRLELMRELEEAEKILDKIKLDRETNSLRKLIMHSQIDLIQPNYYCISTNNKTLNSILINRNLHLDPGRCS